MSALYITVKHTAKCWLVSFQGGRWPMPQNYWIPLPLTGNAPFPLVKRYLAERFPGCRVSASARTYDRAGD